MNFISINPDTHTFSGHYFFYDFNLMNMCKQSSLDFFSLCWKNTSGISPELEKYFIPTFSDHSWSIGNKGLQGAASSMRANFQQELRDGIDKVRYLTGKNETLLYMYTGSLDHAEEISQVVLAEDNLIAVINLFWLPFFDVYSFEFKRRWLTFVKMMARTSKICLTVTTVEMQQAMLDSTGIRFSVSPHPNTSFSDQDFLKIRIKQSRGNMFQEASREKFKILFPGRVGTGKIGLEKGYLLTTEIIIQLNEIKSAYLCESALRKFPEVKQPLATQAVTKLESQGVAKFIDGDLSPDGFIEMLKWADVIVLPYFKTTFAWRTSGLFTDSIYLEKPVISLKGTWMGNRIEEFNCGVVAEDEEPASFVKAINETINNYSYYRNNAIIASSQWFQSNSWQSLFASIITPEYPSFAN